MKCVYGYTNCCTNGTFNITHMKYSYVACYNCAVFISAHPSTQLELSRGILRIESIYSL